MTSFVAALRIGCLCLLLGLATSAWAHKGSDAYLDVRQSDGVADSAVPDTVRFRLSVALRDLDQVVEIDTNQDGKLTWGEVKAALPQLLALLTRSANTVGAGDTAAGSTCRLDWRSDGLERRSDGVYLRVLAQAVCAAGPPLAWHYTLFRDQDATHRLLIGGRLGQQDLLTTVSPQRDGALLLRRALQPSTGNGPVAGTDPSTGRWTALRDYFLLGMHHLLQGYDHLAFLLALVLPLQLVLARRRVPHPAGAVPAQQGHTTWVSLLRTVTAFTIGHSITLVLATLGLTSASPAWVEPVIALSIAVTAALNLRPLPSLRTEWLALGFGMVHGYGFAGLLLEAAAPTGLLPWALAGFNLGVEAGQLLAVSAWVLLVQAVVLRPWYRQRVVRGGSWCLIVLALWWFWQRVF